MRLFLAPLTDVRQITLVAILGGVYFAAAKLGLKLAFVHPSATPVWPATGIALAFLLLIGYHAWPGIFVGAFLAIWTTEGTIWTSLGIAMGNTLEGVIGAYLVNTYAGGTNAFDRTRDVFKFALGAGLVSTMVNPTIGVTTLSLAGFARWADYGPIWLTWWLGDATGALIVAPLLVLWGTQLNPRWDRRAVGERAVFVVALLLVSWIVFSGRFPFEYLTVPFLVWAAFRFGKRDTATVIALLTAIAIWSTLRGLGPFVGATFNASLLQLQAFMGIMVLVALPLASIVAERASASGEIFRRMASEELARRAAERAVERATRLQSITAALSEAITPEEVADVIVTHAVQALGATAAAVSLLTPDGSALELVRSVGYPREVTQRWQRFSPLQYQGLADAMRTGQIVWHESEDALHARYPGRESLPDAIRRGSRAAVPLMSRGAAIGTLYMNFQESRLFDEADREFMLTLGRQCAQAVERARLYEREHRVAETLQRAFLPAVLPRIPGLAIHAAYQPGVRESDIGGDWYDVFQLPNGHVALSIGDVVGHGLEAAVIMGQVRQSIRAAVLQEGAPATVLERASQILKLTYAHGGMATALFAIFDPVSSTLSYATAGHPAPILAVPGRDPAVLAAGGLPLGYLDTEHVSSWVVELPPGTLLVLYTDGLIEATRDPVTGQQAALGATRNELARPSANPAQGIVQQVLAGGRAHDDIAVITLALDATPLDAFDLTLPAEPSSPALIRQSLRRLAKAVGLEDNRAAALTIAVGEAVNNVVEHAYYGTAGTVRVRARRDDIALRVEVADEGAWRPSRAPDGGGHGLQLMSALVESVEIDTTAAGTTVTMIMLLSDAPSPPGAAHPSRDQEQESAASPEAHHLARSHGTAEMAGTPLRSASFDISDVEGFPSLAVRGDLDMSTAAAFHEALEQAARNDSPAVIVSLIDVSYIDSQSIRALFLFGRRLATHRRSLVLAVPSSSPLARIITAAGLDIAFQTFGSTEQAVRGIKKP